MQWHELEFSYTARYYKSGAMSVHTRQIWFVLHGYGQLAQYFIRKFRPLEEHQICIIAAEGLSRFYLEDVTSRVQSGNNRVGATWMTRENRAMDIRNYLHYLNTLYDREIPKGNTIPVTILGFSQGAATATRWVIDGKIQFDRLLLWAGIFPPDIDFDTGKAIFAGKETALIYGTADPFLQDSRFAEMKLLSEKLGIQPSIVTFEGGHDIDPDTLLKFT
jgi:predicted esterase